MYRKPNVYGFYNQFFAFLVTIKLASGFKIIKFRNEHKTLTVVMISIPAILCVRQATWKSRMSARVCMRCQLCLWTVQPILHIYSDQQTYLWNCDDKVWKIVMMLIHSFSILSDDSSKASSKTMSPHSAIKSFLLQMRVSSPVLKVIQ